MEYEYPFKNVNETLKSAVWDKAIIIHGVDKDILRIDKCGAFIKYLEHGQTFSEFGWEIDHITPRTFGGSDDLTNLQPLQWQNNRKKGDTLNWHCK